jgi:nitroreductase/dihydropteridine reductase
MRKRHKDLFKFNTKKFRRISRNHCRSTYKCRRGVYAKHFEQEDKDDGRFAAQEFKANVRSYGYLQNIHRYDPKDLPHWMEKQV